MRRTILSLLAIGLVCGLTFLGWTNRASQPASHLDRSEKVPGTKRPSDWGWIQRTYPHYTADPAAYRLAINEAQLLRAAQKVNRFGEWTFVGPTNIGGRVVDVAYDPKRPEIMYAAAATGGVFKSIDHGQTWLPVFDDQVVLNIGDLAVDPVAPETLYVGTGEANGGHNNYAGGGLFKSIDGGVSWSLMGLEETVSIGRILIHPTDTQRLYVAAAGSYFLPHPERGVYRSDDGGNTWGEHPVLFVSDSTGAIDLIMRPDSPNVLLAAMWSRVRRPDRALLYGEESGIYRTFDGGNTWEKLGTSHGLPDPEDFRDDEGRVRFGRIGLALCEAEPDVMYALYTDGFDYLGLYRSDNGGDTWYEVDQNKSIRFGTGGFSWYFGQVRVHPSDPETVYVMDVSFMRSTDGGRIWVLRTGTHVDHHALDFHPDNPDIQISGNDGGIAFSNDGGVLWTKVLQLPITQFYEINIDPTYPERLYGGTQDNGTVRTLEGMTDGWSRILGRDGFYVIVDPENPDVIYAESQHGEFYKSTNGGYRFQRSDTGIAAGEKRNWSTPVVMDPNNNQVLYFGTTRLYRTENAATFWYPISDFLPRHTPPSGLIGSITTIAVAPTDSDVIYAGTDDGNVWVTADYGDTWQDITGDLPLRWVTRVVVSPEDANTAYVTFSGLKWKDPQPHVFRTSDGGQTWQNISSDLPDAPVNAFAVDPYHPERLYLGNDIGVFASLDAGVSWLSMGTGLPVVAVSDLKIDPTEYKLVAGTHGRSMYSIDLSSGSTSIDQDLLVFSDLLLKPNYPNPFSSVTRLSFDCARPAYVRLEVYDILGRRVRILYDQFSGTLSHTVTWDGTDESGGILANGTYIGKLTAANNGTTATRSINMTLVR